MENEALQRRIDAHITRLMSSLYDLRFQRNTLSPISRLPTEILQGIFVHGASSYYCQKGPLAWSAPDWVNVSYVCRHWRNVALDCPTLWTYVFVASQWWTKALLARSKQAPLKIRTEIGYPVKKWLEFFKTVVDHAERIQELRLLRGNANDGDFAPGLRPFPRTPRLQVLEVEGYGYSRIDSGIFDEGTPPLRKLKLSDRCMPWYQLQLSGLTSLSLENGLPPGIAMVELQSLLRCTHDLVHLHIWNVLAGAPVFLTQADFDTSRRLNLPHLSRLSIAAPLSTVVAFLSFVKIPSKTEMRLRCYDEDNVYLVNDCSLLAENLCSSGDQALSVPTISTFGVHYSNRELVFSSSEPDGHSCSRVLFQSDVPRDYNIPEFKLGIKFKFVSIHPEQDCIASDICRIASSKDFRTVHVCGLKHASTFWENALGHFQELRELKVTVSKISDLISALSLVSCDDTENQDGYVGQRLLCAPHLEVLECGLCWVDGVQDIRSLRRALSIRQEQGRALKRLAMEDITMNGPDSEDILDLLDGEVCLDGEAY